eukprot:12850093-Alexandrium_andersonii.AAC.1
MCIRDSVLTSLAGTPHQRGIRGSAAPPLPARPACPSAAPAEGQAPRSSLCLDPGVQAELPGSGGEPDTSRA